KGVPFVYYGEEIGMHNIIAKNLDEMVDIQGKTHYELALAKGKNPIEALLEGNENNRDKSRSPMQWNGKPFAGFSDEKTWIKINSDYQKNNVEELLKKETSILNRYKKLIALRNNEKVLQYGEYDRLEHKDDQILFTRSFEGDQITVVINFGSEKKINLPKGGEILMGTAKLKTNDFIIYRN
ncbi:MAG TPA: glucohydrolase, partial [Flavobacterium sp.]|nr:glucohydrolase [Flavobacterium sp.]